MAAKASCQVTIADITDAYSAVLTSETYTFMGNTSGAPIGSACTTQAMAYQGNIRCSKVTIGTISCPTGISASVSNNGTASPTITFKTTAVIAVACEASIPVIIDGITIYKKFSFAVANQGAGFGWNLVRNSNLSDGTKYIVAEGATMNVVDDSVYGKALTVTPVSGKRIYWNVEKVWGANTTYTVSFIAKASVAGQKIQPSRSLADYGEDISLSTVYKQYTTQIVSTATVDGGTLSFSFSNASGDIAITNVKLEKGTKATEWTPHPDDLIGDTGKGIKSTAITYQASTSGTTVPTGTWSGSIPTVSAGQYLWVRTIFSYSDNTTSTIYSVSRMGANGTNGTDGSNGKSIGSVVNYYLATASSSGVTTATSGWTTAVQSVSAAKKYLWNYEVVKYTDGTVASTTMPCVIGSYGDQGSKGDKGDTGSTGNGIKSITEHYAVSTSNSTVPTSWSSTVPTMTESNKYLWNYETITYTNGTMVDTTKRVIGVYGNKGATGAKGYSLVANVVRDTFTEEQWSRIGTINRENSWDSTSGIRNGCRIGDIFTIVGTSTDTKNAHIAYYRSNTASGDLKGICISHTIIPRGATGATGSKGDKGDTGASGKGVKSTAVTYQASSSGTTIPTGVWSATPPATSADKPYFWTRTIIIYTDNTTSTAYNVGSTPEGIVVGGRNLLQKTSDEWSDYWKPASGTNVCVDIRSFTIPDNCSVGDIFTTAIEIEWTGFKSSSAGTFALSSQGSQDGTWTHDNPFANGLFRITSESGKQIFTLTKKWDGSCKKYMISMRCDYSSGAGKIRWRRLKIEKGNMATDWTPAPEDYVSFVDVEYYLSTSATSLSGGSWSTTAPTWVNGKYMWSRTVTTDGGGNKTYSPNQNGVCIAGAQGSKGDKGDTGGTGKGVKSIVEQYYKSTSATSLNGGSWGTTYPGWENGKYIWARSVITYTDNTSSTTTAVCVTGTKGDKGDKGTTGATGSQGYSLVANVVRDAFTESRWTTYGTINHEETWSSTSGIRNGCRIGDMFAIVGTATDTKNAHVAYYRSNTASGDLKGLCISHTIIPRGATGATGSKGDKGDKGESDIKCYPLTGGSNQIVWSKLGTLTSAGDNSNFIINVYTGSGYNGYAYQNSQAEIVIKDGWQSSASTTSAFGVSVTRQNCDDLKVQVRATASNKCDVWIYLPWSYSWGTYTISGKYTSWALSNTTQTAEPTTGTLQNLSYRINPENAAKTATNFMEFTSGVGLQIGNKTNGSWSGYRTKISSSAFEILNQAGTVLASYGEKLIQLGKNATDAVIELCGGKGKIKYEQMWTYGGKDPTLTVSGQNTALLGDDKVLVKMQHNSNGNRYTRQLFASENNIHIGMFKGKATDPDEADDIEACITETADGIKLDVPSKDIALEAVQINMTTLSKLIYPVGSIYMSANSTNPKNLFGGTWVAWGTGRVPIGVNASDSDFSYVEKTGGSKTINLSHKHLETVGADNGSMYLEGGSNGGRHGSGIAASISRMTWKGTVGTGSARLNYTDSAGNTKQSVVQPYITCYMWKRTA